MSRLIDQRALAAHLRQLEQNIANAPTHVLEAIRHEQEIDAHNAAIDKKKADRKKLRQVAKQARVPLPVLKRVLASAKRGPA